MAAACDGAIDTDNSSWYERYVWPARTGHAENHPNEWCWAEQVTDALLDVKRAADKGPADPAFLKERTCRILSAATIAANAPASGKLAKKHRALARRICHRIDDYLAFARDPTIPFTNNVASPVDPNAPKAPKGPLRPLRLRRPRRPHLPCPSLLSWPPPRGPRARKTRPTARRRRSPRHSRKSPRRC